MIIHKRGRGFVNKIINKLPFELHIPGYQYCGPGTKLAKRLARGDLGINSLDAACKEHDIAYSRNRENIQARNTADKILADRAWNRVKSKDASFGEKAAAYAITNTMKLKSRFGMGLKKKKSKKQNNAKKLGMGLKSKRRKQVSLKKIIKAGAFESTPSNCAQTVIRSALKKARSAVKEAGGKNNIKIPRILPVPVKTGGVLPFLIPLFAGLSATGALAGGAAGIVKAVNDAKAAKRQLEENKRHNKTMEGVALGNGLYLKPHKVGLGLHLRKKKSSIK